MFLALCSVLSWTARAQEPAITWVNPAGGPGEDFGWSVAVDGGTNVFVTGHFTAPATFGNTNLSRGAGLKVFVARYTTSGGFVWVRQAGGPTNDDARGIVADANGNAYVTGNFTGPATFSQFSLSGYGGPDVFVAKYDRDGNVIWVRPAGGSGDDEGQGIALDGAGNVYVTGYFSGTATFGTTNLVSRGSQDIFVAKYDSGGNFLWARSAGSTNDDEGFGVAADAAGNSYLTGYFRSAATFGANTLNSYGGGDIFVAKYDSDGNLVWVRQAGSSVGVLADIGNGITLDSKDNVCVTGTFTGEATFGNVILQGIGVAPDIFVAKYDRAGNLLWARREGGDGSDNGHGVGVDASDYIYVAGQFLGTVSFGTNVFESPSHADFFTVKYDPAGNLLWAVHAGGNGYKAGYGLAVHPEGPAFATGFFRGSTTFGNFTLVAPGATNVGSSNRDIWVARIDGPPSPPRLRIAPAGDKAVLSWTSNAMGFTLQTVAALSSNNLWTTVTNAQVWSGGRNFVTNAISGTNRFYRLRKP